MTDIRPANFLADVQEVTAEYPPRARTEIIAELRRRYSKNPDILAVDPQLVANTFAKAQRLGLIEGVDWDAIVRMDRGSPKIQVEIGKFGAIKLIHRVPGASGAVARNVYQAEIDARSFEIRMFDTPPIHHVMPHTSGTYAGTYATCRIHGLWLPPVWIPADEMMRFKARFGTRKGPWQDSMHVDRMYEKTALKRLRSTLPMEADAAYFMDSDDTSDAGADDIAPVSTTPTPPPVRVTAQPAKVKTLLEEFTEKLNALHADPEAGSAARDNAAELIGIVALVGSGEDDKSPTETWTHPAYADVVLARPGLALSPLRRLAILREVYAAPEHAEAVGAALKLIKDDVAAVQSRLDAVESTPPSQRRAWFALLAGAGE